MPDLNPAQADAVATLSGPLLVLAGAGTGKTRVVTFRVANLIKHKTAPDRILAVTFTNKASLEMQERIGHQLKLPKRVKKGQKASPRPQIGTFHSHCVQILKRWTSELGYRRNLPFTTEAMRKALLGRFCGKSESTRKRSLRPTSLTSSAGGKTPGSVPIKPIRRPSMIKSTSQPVGFDDTNEL